MRDYVTILNDKAQGLKNMVQEVLDVSKAASGNLNLHWEELTRLLRQTLADQAEPIAASGPWICALWLRRSRSSSGGRRPALPGLSKPIQECAPVQSGGLLAYPHPGDQRERAGGWRPEHLPGGIVLGKGLQQSAVRG